MTFLATIKNTIFIWVLLLWSCGNSTKKKEGVLDREKKQFEVSQEQAIIVGANNTDAYLPLLRNKEVAVVANQTSVIFRDTLRNANERTKYTHLVDSLIALQINVAKVFAPEHGFRGKADAGETVKDGTDTRTGLPLISLYGKNKKPTKMQLQGIDAVVFDIQDVGVRFYTYIATLQLVMEACATSKIPIIVLDRPNPNGGYVDGPTMKPENTSFLGMTPIPLVYGLTIGEYAHLLNEEQWLEGGLKADLTVIPLKNYTHKSSYHLPIRPSPNLPNDQAIKLYPSLGLFEGTAVNAGRGTEMQFQRYGASFLDSTVYDFSYRPQSNFGAKYPKEMEKRCYGKDLSTVTQIDRINLFWLLDAYKNCIDKSLFFNTNSFTKHAGTALLQEQIESGFTATEIKNSWKKDIDNFKKIRQKYLHYPD